MGWSVLAMLFIPIPLPSHNSVLQPPVLYSALPSPSSFLPLLSLSFSQKVSSCTKIHDLLPQFQKCPMCRIYQMPKGVDSCLESSRRTVWWGLFPLASMLHNCKVGLTDNEQVQRCGLQAVQSTSPVCIVSGYRYMSSFLALTLFCAVGTRQLYSTETLCLSILQLSEGFWEWQWVLSVWLRSHCDDQEVGNTFGDELTTFTPHMAPSLLLYGKVRDVVSNEWIHIQSIQWVRSKDPRRIRKCVVLFTL